MARIFKLLAERRLIAAVVLLAAGAYGFTIEDEQAKVITVAVNWLSSAAFVWSRFQKIERAELYRRLIGGLVPAVYTVLGVVFGDMLADNERAEFAQGLAAVVSLALGGWSFAQENAVKPAVNP